MIHTLFHLSTLPTAIREIEKIQQGSLLPGHSAQAFTSFDGLSTPHGKQRLNR